VLQTTRKGRDAGYAPDKLAFHAAGQGSDEVLVKACPATPWKFSRPIGAKILEIHVWNRISKN